MAEGDVSPFWTRLFSAVDTVDAAIDLAIQASASDTNDKAISAITKKRLVQRSQQGLLQSKSVVQELVDNLKGLQQAARDWQNNAAFASKSQKELMEQTEAMSMDLQSTVDQMRRTEAARQVSSREAQELKLKVSDLQSEKQALEATLSASRKEADSARDELQQAMEQMEHGQREVYQMQQEAERCRQDAQRATAALDAAQSEAARQAALAQRHQEVVAQLTADNLVLLMQLRKAEAELDSVLQERGQLRLAVERQKGPWFAEVRAGVEAKVKEAMARGDDLEKRMEDMRAQHQQELQRMAHEKTELETFLEASRVAEARLSTLLEQANEDVARAKDQAQQSYQSAEEQRTKASDLAAQVRALLDSARSMREECNQRWANEQAAEKRAAGVKHELETCRSQLVELDAALRRAHGDLESQAGINRQLMARKEEVEWQLMTAMAQASGGDPLPLNVLVSGRMQVDRSYPQAPPHLAPRQPRSATPDSDTSEASPYAQTSPAQRPPSPPNNQHLSPTRSAAQHPPAPANSISPQPTAAAAITTSAAHMPPFSEPFPQHQSRASSMHQSVLTNPPTTSQPPNPAALSTVPASNRPLSAPTSHLLAPQNALQDQTMLAKMGPIATLSAPHLGASSNHASLSGQSSHSHHIPQQYNPSARAPAPNASEPWAEAFGPTSSPVHPVLGQHLAAAAHTPGRRRVAVDVFVAPTAEA